MEDGPVCDFLLYAYEVRSFMDIIYTCEMRSPCFASLHAANGLSATPRCVVVWWFQWL
jgi:hypothetical protein